MAPLLPGLRADGTEPESYQNKVSIMQLLKLICQATVGLFRQVGLFPHVLAVVLKRRRRQFALNVLEAERLDRIRNPSKYLGK
jgi:hypothetical protein